MIAIRPYRMMSWLDPASARYLSHDLRMRLRTRLKGERGVMLALTYDRSIYDSPRDLWARAQAGRHIRRFIARLTKACGESLSGRWIRKAEFQTGGWLHYHVIITGVRYIPKAVIDKCWGHGHAYIERLRPKHAGYLAKGDYLSKPDGVPDFLLGERSRAVKIVAASPGFWRNPPAGRHSTVIERSADGEVLSVRTVVTEVKPRVRQLERQYNKVHAFWVPIGQKLFEAKSKTMLRVVGDNGKVLRHDVVPMSYDALVIALQRVGCDIKQARHGWLEFDCEHVESSGGDRETSAIHQIAEACDVAASAYEFECLPVSGTEGGAADDGPDPFTRLKKVIRHMAAVQYVQWLLRHLCEPVIRHREEAPVWWGAQCGERRVA